MILIYQEQQAKQYFKTSQNEVNMDLTKRVLIVGTEGCGKTTLIAQLTKKTATIKTTKLNENYQESQLSAKFKGA